MGPNASAFGLRWPGARPESWSLGQPDPNAEFDPAAKEEASV